MDHEAHEDPWHDPERTRRVVHSDVRGVLADAEHVNDKAYDADECHPRNEGLSDALIGPLLPRKHHCCTCEVKENGRERNCCD